MLTTNISISDRLINGQMGTIFKIAVDNTGKPEIRRVQFPFTLAWACTVHKVQGLALNKVVISIDLVKQRQLWTNLYCLKLCSVIKYFVYFRKDRE